MMPLRYGSDRWKSSIEWAAPSVNGPFDMKMADRYHAHVWKTHARGWAWYVKDVTIRPNGELLASGAGLANSSLARTQAELAIGYWRSYDEQISSKKART